MIKASKQQILEYIKSLQFIQPWQLVRKFGYTQGGAVKKLWELKQQGLVDNKTYGKWNVTYTGLRRLLYYESKNTNQNKSPAT